MDWEKKRDSADWKEFKSWKVSCETESKYFKIGYRAGRKAGLLESFELCHDDKRGGIYYGNKIRKAMEN